MVKQESTLYRIAKVIAPIIVFLIVFGGLEWAIGHYDVPRWLISKPSDTVQVLFDKFGEIWPNVWVTIKEILIGYVIGISLGISMALLFTSNRFAEKAVSPYVVFLIVTPQIILVPLLMLWMGFGIEVKFTAVALSSFPITMISTMTGVKNVSAHRYELMKSLRATKLQTFFKVLIPSAIPNVFTGMRLATIFATTAAVGAELISGNIGIGPQISYYTEFMQVDIAFAYVYMMMLISVLFYTLIGFIENMILKRR